MKQYASKPRTDTVGLNASYPFNLTASVLIAQNPNLPETNAGHHRGLFEEYLKRPFRASLFVWDKPLLAGHVHIMEASAKATAGYVRGLLKEVGTLKVDRSCASRSHGSSQHVGSSMLCPSKAENMLCTGGL